MEWRTTSTGQLQDVDKAADYDTACQALRPATYAFDRPDKLGGGGERVF